MNAIHVALPYLHCRLLPAMACLALLCSPGPSAGQVVPSAGAGVARMQQAATPSQNSIGNLIRAALRDGRASGWVYGGMAEQFNRQFGLSYPLGQAQKVMVAIERVAQFEGDCGRLQLDLSQPGQTVQDRNGQSTPAQYGFAMNICSNGQPPMDSFNLERLSGAVNAQVAPTLPAAGSK